jgi:putative nucleotidyltransferase with HDIG domain
MTPSPPPVALDLARPAPAPLDAAHLARRILELPPLPTALAEAMRVLSHDELPAQDCVRAIEREPALALRVLQLANSGFYASPSRVGSLSDAVRLLGLRAVAAVLAAVSIKQMLGRLAGSMQSQDRRWHHALATGCAARELARERGLDAEAAFVAGLLHDVGAWLLATFAAEQLPAIKSLQDTEKLDLCSAERRVLGVSHEDVGEQVAQLWRLPADMAAAISHHHQPRQGSHRATELEKLVHVAEVLAETLPGAIDLPGHEQPTGLQPEVWRELALDQGLLDKVRERTLAALASLEHA